jgi:hypothetical protein
MSRTPHDYCRLYSHPRAWLFNPECSFPFSLIKAGKNKIRSDAMLKAEEKHGTISAEKKL